MVKKTKKQTNETLDLIKLISILYHGKLIIIFAIIASLTLGFYYSKDQKGHYSVIFKYYVDIVPLSVDSICGSNYRCIEHVIVKGINTYLPKKYKINLQSFSTGESDPIKFYYQDKDEVNEISRLLHEANKNLTIKTFDEAEIQIEIIDDYSKMIIDNDLVAKQNQSIQDRLEIFEKYDASPDLQYSLDVLATSAFKQFEQFNKASMITKMISNKGSKVLIIGEPNPTYIAADYTLNILIFGLIGFLSGAAISLIRFSIKDN